MPGPMGGGHMGRRGPQTKEKMDVGSMKKLIRYCKRYLPAIVVAVAMAVVSSVTSIIGPNRISDLMDIVSKGITEISGIDMTEFTAICTGLIVLYVVGALSGYIQQFIMAEVTQRTSKKLRTDINGKINKLPLSFFDTTTRGDILSRVTNDVDTISQTLGSSVANLVSATVLFIGVLIMMFTVSAALAGITIASSIVGFIGMSFILARSQKYFNRRQANLGQMNGHVEEIYTNQNTVKSYTAEKAAIDKFEKINNELYFNNYKSQCLSGMMPAVMGFSGNLSYACVFIFGVAFAINGNANVTFGTIISFVMYARLFSQPLSTFAQSMSSLQQASAAGRRVFEILEKEELSDESDKNTAIDEVKGDVTFENVRFGYTEDKEIIHGFSADLKRGQKIAIVGPTGAGKTTIVNLLMRFYEVNSGSIKIDGVPLTDIRREQVHDLFDMILQDTWLFSGTIRENIVYTSKNVTDEKLAQVCKAVGLDHFVSALPNGYDTFIDDRITLSEGQKQQLTIARAMIKDAPMLILDEATSSVDTRTELIIQEAMDNLTKERTSFVIAHRLSTIKNADVILVLKDGDVIEQGNHENLLAQNGFYAELYNSQFSA